MIDLPDTLFAEVAVPLPLPRPLVYRVPDAFRAMAVPGARARVAVGKRRLTGYITGLLEGSPGDRVPESAKIRPLVAVVDHRPLLPPDLLELAHFMSLYYMAPIGEVLASMVPRQLAPWGDQRVWLTDAGALALPRGRSEEAVVTALREGGRMSFADLQAAVGLVDLDAVVEELRERGRVVVAEAGRGGSRYRPAVELASGDVGGQGAQELERLRDLCGRSVPGRQIVDYLAALGRPATVSEVLDAVGCKAGVVRRLRELGVLRSFTQIERLDLDDHVMGPGHERPFELREDQRSAVSALEAALQAREYRAFHLGGVTGAGKTEVYVRAAEVALAQGRGVIVLVPEIALVPALARALRRRFAGKVAMLHSALSGPERHQEWERIRKGAAPVVLGPRSAVFAPLPNPGLIVVDEEQDGSYKQDAVPRYNGRDIALYRGREAGATVVTVSATPSLETRLNLEKGKMTPLTLTGRVGHGELPEGILVDLRSTGAVRRPGEVQFSPRLLEELERTLAAGDQAILLRNRRGYAPILLCRACGDQMRCDDCGLPRTFHKRDGALLCHYCGSRRPVPERCPACGEDALEPVGAGTEKVEETFRELFPSVSVDTLDRDTVRRRGNVAAVLERFRSGQTRVLIGTQMVSKGHHFPNVALAGVLQADTYLGFPDFRAVERTYALLTQLAGRAGRGDRPGRVVIQTFHPDHYAIQAALRGDDQAFAREEMRFRRVFHYPPYTRMIQLLVRDSRRERGEEAIRRLARRLHGSALSRQVRIVGPAPAPLERLRGKWRFQLLIRSESGRRLRRLVEEALAEAPTAELVIDVDPYELL